MIFQKRMQKAFLSFSFFKKEPWVIFSLYPHRFMAKSGHSHKENPLLFLFDWKNEEKVYG